MFLLSRNNRNYDVIAIYYVCYDIIFWRKMETLILSNGEGSWDDCLHHLLISLGQRWKGVLLLLVPLEGQLERICGWHGVEGVWIGWGENVPHYLVHHHLVAGLGQSGVLLDDSHILLLGLPQQVDGVIVGRKILTHEQWQRVVAHHARYASLFGAPPLCHLPMAPSPNCMIFRYADFLWLEQLPPPSPQRPRTYSQQGRELCLHCRKHYHDHYQYYHCWFCYFKESLLALYV